MKVSCKLLQDVLLRILLRSCKISGIFEPGMHLNMFHIVAETAVSVKILGIRIKIVHFGSQIFLEKSVSLSKTFLLSAGNVFFEIIHYRLPIN